MRKIFTVPPYRVALPSAFGLSLLIWGADQLPEEALTTVVAGLPDIAVWRWIAAFGLTGLSLIAMGRLDALWHVALRLNSQPYIARRAGRIAVAISQCVGRCCAPVFLQLHSLGPLICNHRPKVLIKR